MVKFVRVKEISVPANASTEVEKFVGKAGETFKLLSLTFTATGKARLVVYHNQTLITDVLSTLVPDVNYRIQLDLTAEPGDEIVIQVEDLSGATNTVTVYYEYERATR